MCCCSSTIYGKSCKDRNLSRKSCATQGNLDFASLVQTTKSEISLASLVQTNTEISLASLVQTNTEISISQVSCEQTQKSLSQVLCKHRNLDLASLVQTNTSLSRVSCKLSSNCDVKCRSSAGREARNPFSSSSSSGTCGAC